MCSHTALDLFSNFESLSNKFVELILTDQPRSRDINKQLDIILNDLSKLDYSSQNVSNSNQKVQLIQCFTRIPPTDETLIVKANCLIICLLTKQQMLLPNTEFEKITDWLFKCLYCNFDSIACNVLNTFQNLFKYHKNLSLKYWNNFLSADCRILNYIANIKKEKQNQISKNVHNNPEEIVANIVCCLDAVLIIPDNFKGDDRLIPLGHLIIDLLISNEISFKQSILHMNYLIAALSILNKIVLHNKEWYENVLGLLIGISRTYMLTGIEGVPQCAPQKVIISNQNLIEPDQLKTQNKGGKITKTRKPRTIPKQKKTDPISKYGTTMQDLEFDFEYQFYQREQTSDSDYSESEYSKTKNETYKMAKIRLSAISLLGFGFKIIDSKTLFGYWHSIFPSEREIPFSLLTCSTRDPNSRCRIAALQAASMLIYGSKKFLWQAENNDKPPNTFTPFSVSLGNMVLIMYEQLTYALATENSIPTLTQVLKCLSLLIQATPFHRMKSGFVPHFIHQIKKLVHHKDPSVVVGSLMVMEFLVSSSGITPEISSLIELPKTDSLQNSNEPNEMINEAFDEYVSGEEEEFIHKESLSPSTIKQLEKIPWLLEAVFENFGYFTSQPKIIRSSRQVSIRIESFQILTALSKHFQYLILHLDVIAKILLFELNDSQEEIKIYNSKCLDSLAHEMSNYLTVSLNDIEECKQFWLTILPGAVEKIEDPETNNIIKATLCDFLSNIGVQIFERLDHTEQMELVKILSRISCSEEPTVKSASVRVLAVYALFPSMKEDLCFVENTAELILPLMKESNLFVRLRTSWSLSNLSESILTNTSSDYDRISDSLLQRLLQSTIESTLDNDKVKSNAVRTLGNLLCLILPKHIEDLTWKHLIFECIDKLVISMKTGNNAKVKWNACYAVGNLVKNQHLFITNSDFNWQQNVFDNLCFMLNNVNFKVRINASAALQKIESRYLYGNHFIPIWKSLILALERSDNLVDFNEYNHRDNLQEQLCLGFCHFLNLADTYNLYLMSGELQQRKDLIKSIWKRVLYRIIPERAVTLLSTATMLQELSKTNTQIKCLSDCFPNINL